MINGIFLKCVKVFQIACPTFSVSHCTLLCSKQKAIICYTYLKQIAKESLWFCQNTYADNCMLRSNG